MSKDDAPSPGGLLSKVVRFVRNPTVNWSELDSLQTDRESQYSKQVLKDMLERKRRNDFVRRREFDQLRKLRQRDALDSSQRLPEAPARSSLFQSSFTSPDGRAGTIRKIDEIEAQMSRQWWKGTVQPADAPPSLAAADAQGAASAAPLPHVFQSTEPLSLRAALAARTTEAGELLPPSAAFRRSSLSARQALEPAGLAQAHTAAGGAAQAVFVHDPDLEEAAILFANGDRVGAEASLLEVLVQRAGDPAPQQFELWMTLFDLYRATGQQDRFDAIGLDFAARFHRSAPLWLSLPEQLGLGPAAPESAPAALQSERVWHAPAQLTVQSVAALQAWLERHPTPWTLAWKRLVSIDESALPALAAVFSHWAEQPVHLVFTDAATLHGLWQVHTVSGERGSDPQWWQLRMAALRCMNQPDAFEMVALDYCVTYEVSPPSWQLPRCTYQDTLQPAQGAGSDSATAGSGTASVLAHWSDPTQPLTLPGLWLESASGLPGLEGCIQGDASDGLEALASASAGAPLLRIPCERLICLDFAAAGSVLNWAAHQQGLGRKLTFERPHRLAAVFLNVIGINEYAAVQPRAD